MKFSNLFGENAALIKRNSILLSFVLFVYFLISCCTCASFCFFHCFVSASSALTNKKATIFILLFQFFLFESFAFLLFISRFVGYSLSVIGLHFRLSQNDLISSTLQQCGKVCGACRLGRFGMVLLFLFFIYNLIKWTSPERKGISLG